MSGLAYLSNVDTILVHQMIDFPGFRGVERRNQYKIMNSEGEIKYYAREESNFFARKFLRNKRPFHMNIVNNDTKEDEVIHLHRPYALPWQRQTLKVCAPAPNEYAGCIEQVPTCFKPSFNVKNSQGDVVLKIKGPRSKLNCFASFDFNVYSEDGKSKVGKISKHWAGLLQELFTEADNFGISFPASLDVRMKAVLLGAIFLIDYIYFEKHE